MRKIILSLLGILLIIGAVFSAKTLISNKKKPKPITKAVVKTVLMDTVQNKDISITIPANGKLIAKQRIELFAEVQGIFKPGLQLFRAGQVYAKGTTLISIDANEFYTSVQIAKSNFYNTLIAMMPDLRLDFTEVSQKWQSYIRQFDLEKNIPALPKFTNDKERYFITGRGILGQYYQVKNLEKRLEKYTIKAPFDGILTQALITEGTFIRNGQKLGEFIQPKTYEMEISISKSFADFLLVGKKVTLQNLDKTKTYTGTITRINGSLDANTQTITLFAEVSHPDLKEGMYLEAMLAAKKISNAIEVNRNLLINNQEIFCITQGKLAKIKVQPVYFSDTKVVLQHIPNGTVILKNPVPGAYVGMQVKPYLKKER